MPNPFRTETQIAVSIPAAFAGSNFALDIYNLLGQRILTLPLASAGTKGQTTLTWNGKDAHGNDVPTGTYFLTLSAPQKRVTVRLVKLD